MSGDVPDTLPEYCENPFIARLPPVLSAAGLFRTLQDLPRHDEAERRLPSHLRIHCAMRLGRYFDPNERHIALEQRMDVLIRQGYLGRNPNTTDYYLRLRNDLARVSARSFDVEATPMCTTANGFALIGVSGMGKTDSITRILKRYPQVIEHVEPVAVSQVPWVKLECPYKGSVKQLCFDFFSKMDELLGTSFRKQHGGRRAGVDDVTLQMAAIANRHAVGLIVIDEIQHLTEAQGTGSKEMLNFLVTLVNRCSTPVMIIGTPRALPLVQGAFRQARRASGVGSVMWERMTPGKTWDHFVRRMWAYQWTREHVDLSDEIRAVLYDESQGIIDVLVKLYMLAQVRAISFSAMEPRPEPLDAKALRRTAEEYLGLIQPMISALRSGRAEIIAQYDDLEPFALHVRRALDDALMRAGAAPDLAALDEPTIGETAKGSETADDAPIIAALERLGLAPDIARIMVHKARAGMPGASALELSGIVMDMVRGRGPETPPKRSKGRPRKVEVEAALVAGDIRAIVGPDKSNCYDALLAAGVVKPPACSRLVMEDGFAAWRVSAL
ncbi:ATP-binding protein [Salinarimonas rosea]|uniref:ATP-binding protein n=1 Tax=Salinarimonas rosea TaxID=552063 RepID=UPI000412B235|nr:ATP-binding protein [Salinarimonas rosea]